MLSQVLTQLAFLVKKQYFNDCTMTRQDLHLFLLGYTPKCCCVAIKIILKLVLKPYK